MHLQRLKLRYEVTGKLPSARVSTSYLMSEDVNVHVKTVDLRDLVDGINVLRKIDGSIETIKVHDGKYYIKNDVNSDADRQLRASAFLISDYKVAEALGRFSTFEVLHYNNAKLLQQDVLSELPVDLRESNFDTVREAADSELYKSAHEKLIMANEVVYLEAGDPVICFRFVKGNLQVFLAFRQSESVKTDFPIIMVPTREIMASGLAEINRLVELFKTHSDGQVLILSEVDYGGSIKPQHTYSFKKQLLTLAQKFAKDENQINSWSPERFSIWQQLKGVLKTYQADVKNGDIISVSDVVLEYSKHYGDVDIRNYTIMLHDLIPAPHKDELIWLNDL